MSSNSGQRREGASLRRSAARVARVRRLSLVPAARGGAAWRRTRRRRLVDPREPGAVAEARGRAAEGAGATAAGTRTAGAGAAEPGWESGVQQVHPPIVVHVPDLGGVEVGGEGRRPELEHTHRVLCETEGATSAEGPPHGSSGRIYFRSARGDELGAGEHELAVSGVEGAWGHPSAPAAPWCLLAP